MALFAVQRRLMSGGLQNFCYRLAGFNKLGLMRDDLLDEDDDVREALKRLPQRKVDERNFRILRATQLDVQKSILPKDQWTKLEEDELYLTPLVDQVAKEREEREQWSKDF